MRGDHAIEGVTMCSRQTCRAQGESSVDRQQNVTRRLYPLHEVFFEFLRLWQPAGSDLRGNLPGRRRRDEKSHSLVLNPLPARALRRAVSAAAQMGACVSTRMRAAAPILIGRPPVLCPAWHAAASPETRPRPHRSRRATLPRAMVPRRHRRARNPESP